MTTPHLPHLFEEHVGTVYDGLGQVYLVCHVADFSEGIDEGTVWAAHLRRMEGAMKTQGKEI